MSAAQKKEPKEPSLFGAYVLGLFSAVIGVLLGFIFLSAFEAKAFSSTEERIAFEAEEVEEGAEVEFETKAYYLEGARSNAAAWKGQREQFLKGESEVTELSIADLNAWMASSFRTSNAPSKEGQGSFSVVPGTPNFYAEENGLLSINLPVEVLTLGKSYDYTLSVRGHFNNSRGAAFVLDHIQVNSAPIPIEANTSAQILKGVLTTFGESEEFEAISAAWERVESVEVGAGAIRIKHPAN